MPGCRAEYAVSWGKEFLSTPSARRATKRLEGLTSIQKISIHALREEGDEHAESTDKLFKDFYPRPP